MADVMILSFNLRYLKSYTRASPDAIERRFQAYK